MVRGNGRKFVEICLLAYDGIVEGLYQGRMNLLSVDPHPSAVPHIAHDTGIVPGVFETIRSFMLRRRRARWSWRAAGLAGVADIHLNTDDWGGAIPLTFAGRPTEEGIWISVTIGGSIGVGFTYELSVDGGMSYGAPIAHGIGTTLTVGDVTVTFRSGDSIPVGTLRINHGGRGLLLNDLGAPIRGNLPGSSPAGDESLLHEIAAVVGTCRIRLASMNQDSGVGPARGTWWTREEDGTVWRFNSGPWAWESEKDMLPEYWSRGVIIIDSPPNIDPWDVLGVGSHYLDEPYASFGTTATVEWWNRLLVTIGQFKPANMLVTVIINFDPTKFDPNDAATCMQGDWYLPHTYDVSGNVTLTRPVEYAWFSLTF